MREVGCRATHNGPHLPRPQEYWERRFRRQPQTQLVPEPQSQGQVLRAPQRVGGAMGESFPPTMPSCTALTPVSTSERAWFISPPCDPCMCAVSDAGFCMRIRGDGVELVPSRRTTCFWGARGLLAAKLVAMERERKVTHVAQTSVRAGGDRNAWVFETR